MVTGSQRGIKIPEFSRKEVSLLLDMVEEGVDRQKLYNLVGCQLYHLIFAHLDTADRCDLRDSFTMGLPLPKGVVFPSHYGRDYVERVWHEAQQSHNLSRVVVINLEV
jgi:hypothetical protein